MSQKPKICVPVSENTIEKALKSARNYIQLVPDILELRIDAINNPDPFEVKNLVKEIDFPLIVTNRMSQEGGSFRGSEEERIQILVAAAEEADFVDIELQTDPVLRSKVVETPAKTIVSFHDFNKTPPLDELLKIVKAEKEVGDIAKFAVMPRKMEDTLTVLEVLAHEKDTIGISMGELGKYTRLVAPLFGSPFTFASAGSTTAPGQLDLENTRFIINNLFTDEK